MLQSETMAGNRGCLTCSRSGIQLENLTTVILTIECQPTACGQDVPRGARGRAAIGRCCREVLGAELGGGYWLKPLKDSSDYWAMESARRLIEAYAAAEEALGAERAVGFAVRGEVWRPFDVREEAGALFFGAARR